MWVNALAALILLVAPAVAAASCIIVHDAQSDQDVKIEPFGTNVRMPPPHPPPFLH